MGTPEFAVPCLSKLHKSQIEVVSVITAPDKPSGRGRKLRSSAVKDFAVENNIPLLQPSNLKDPEFLNNLKKLKADLFVVVAFRMLPKLVWEMPALGTINLHASLLPNYRGAAPINWAIINGESKTGLSTFFINENIDTGAIIDQLEIDIDKDENLASLHDRMSETGSKLLLETVRKIFRKEISPKEQIKRSTDKDAPKLNPENTRIDFGKSVLEVHNLIRGLSPYPGAYTFYKAKNEEALKVKIFRTEYEQRKDHDEAGFISSNDKDELLISCKDGFIKVMELQIQGKKRMKIKDLLNGFKFDLQGQFV